MINASVTNADGRCANFIQQHAFHSGRYKLTFGVEEYFKNNHQNEAFYPIVEVMSIIQFAFSLFHTKQCGLFLIYCVHIFVLIILTDSIRLQGWEKPLSYSIVAKSIRLYYIPWNINLILFFHYRTFNVRASIRIYGFMLVYVENWKINNLKRIYQ